MFGDTALELKSSGDVDSDDSWILIDYKENWDYNSRKYSGDEFSDGDSEEDYSITDKDKKADSTTDCLNCSTSDEDETSFCPRCSEAFLIWDPVLKQSVLHPRLLKPLDPVQPVKKVRS